MTTPEVRWAASAADIRAAEAEPLAREGEPALMDRAALAVANAAWSLLAKRSIDAAEIRAVLLVGTGNNGGDALLAGTLLARRGADVTALLVAGTAHLRGLTQLGEAGGRAVSDVDPAAAKEYFAGAHLVIDGIVGLGGGPGLREPAASLVRAIPSSATVLAVDLPSGLDADDASASASHVTAHATVSFTAPTSCILLPPAALDAGCVTFADVGVPAPDTAPNAPRRLTPAGAAAWWPVPTVRDSKYSRGVVGVIAGSERYPGAAVLTSSAAVRAGAGLVRYVGPRRAQDLVLAARPEVIVAEPSEASVDLPKVDAWVLGPGIEGGSPEEAIVTAALATGLPTVVDAGAIDGCVSARVGGDHPTPADRLLLTPHVGELERALAIAGAPATRAQIEADPASHAKALARAADATVLLKGAVTLIVTPGGTVWSQADGPAWLATGGAGDVLAGIAGVLLAAGLPADRAGALAALVHGRAATLASNGGPIAALDVASALAAIVASLGGAVASVLSEGGRAV